MSKKGRLIVGALGVLLLLFSVYKIYNSLGNNSDYKSITINIVSADENTMMTLGSYKNNLSDFLVEQADDGYIKLDYENGDYGMFITGLGSLQSVKAETGQAWVYSSSNNKSCLNDASGYCPSAETLKIEDGDEFTFELISY